MIYPIHHALRHYSYFIRDSLPSLVGAGVGRARMVAMVGKDAAPASSKWGTGMLGGSRSRVGTCRALVGAGM